MTLLQIGHCSAVNTFEVKILTEEIRLKAGAVPQIFNFPAHLQRVCALLATRNLVVKDE